MWITSGVGYNVADIRTRLPDAPVDSWRMLFDPAVVSRFQTAAFRFSMRLRRWSPRC